MDIEKIARPLRKLLSQREIISRCELLLRTYDIVRSANLSDQDRKELGGMVGERLAPGIFASILSNEPVFLDLQKLDTYTQMNGRIFHFQHTKRYSKQDFDRAASLFQRSLPELKAIQQQCLADRLKEFMADAGYTLTGESGPKLAFSAEKRNIKASVVTSIKALDIDKFDPEKGSDYIILVASSDNVEPFMQFFQEKGQAAEDKGLQIWIMNLEKGTIDPFIGYTTDLDIYNQFNNPRLAEMVRSNWNRTQ